MKVTKHYEQGVIILYLIEGDTSDRIVLDNDQQMRRLGECLIDLERTGGREVIISPVNPAPQNEGKV